MTKLDKLSAIQNGTVHVVVEACRGMTAKCRYDPERGLFVLGKPLPHGLVYPYDWGFIPGTKGGDGDPLDALVLHDAACPVGCLMECDPIAVLQIEEQEKGKKKERNDRFILIPVEQKKRKKKKQKEQNKQNPEENKTNKKDKHTTQQKREVEQFFEGTVLHDR